MRFGSAPVVSMKRQASPARSFTTPRRKLSSHVDVPVFMTSTDHVPGLPAARLAPIVTAPIVASSAATAGGGGGGAGRLVIGGIFGGTGTLWPRCTATALTPNVAAVARISFSRAEKLMG